MRHIALRAANTTFVRYVAASGVALCADMGAFLVLLHLGMAAMMAAALSYSLGILVHWLVSSRGVFIASTADRGPRRTRQKALFTASALVGLALTSAIVGTAAAAGIDPRLAKPVAVAVSFLVTWGLRNRVVFADAPQ